MAGPEAHWTLAFSGQWVHSTAGRASLGRQLLLGTGWDYRFLLQALDVSTPQGWPLGAIGQHMTYSEAHKLPRLIRSGNHASSAATTATTSSDSQSFRTPDVGCGRAGFPVAPQRPIPLTRGPAQKGPTASSAPQHRVRSRTFAQPPLGRGCASTGAAPALTTSAARSEEPSPLRELSSARFAALLREAGGARLLITPPDSARHS